MKAQAAEAEICDWLEAILVDRGARVRREVPAMGARIDMVVEAQYVAAIEVKASGDTQSLYQALGQACCYRVAGYGRVAVATPATEYTAARILDTFTAHRIGLLELFLNEEIGRGRSISVALPNVHGRGLYPWGETDGRQDLGVPSENRLHSRQPIRMARP